MARAAHARHKAAGCHPAWARTIAQWHRAAWLAVPDSEGRSYPVTGVRPVDSLADVVFALALVEFQKELQPELNAEGLSLRLPVKQPHFLAQAGPAQGAHDAHGDDGGAYDTARDDEGASANAAHDAQDASALRQCRNVTVAQAGYMDDVAVPIVAATAAELLPAVASAAACLCRVAQRFALPLKISQGKTDVALCLHGRGLRSARDQLASLPVDGDPSYEADAEAAAQVPVVGSPS